MNDYLELGSGPPGETCPQVGRANYSTEARRYAKIWIAQLEREFKPKHAWLTLRSFPHDFGTYYEVCANWDDEAGMEEAFAMESSQDEWDEISKRELKKHKWSTLA